MQKTGGQTIHVADEWHRRGKSLSIANLYLIVVGFLLVGYAFSNKGFAYIGYNPIYVGEVVLGLGLFAMLAGGGSLRCFRSPISWVLFLYFLWQVLILIPGLTEYGFLALRDSAIWLYSIYALFVSAALLRARAVAKVPEWYLFFMPAWVFASPFIFISTELFLYQLPKIPGTDVSIIWMKPGDMGVQLGGAAAFLALGLQKQFRRSLSRYSPSHEIYVWIFLLIGLLACGSRNRGGMLAAISACALVTLFKPMNRLTRIVLPLLVVVIVAFAIDLKIPVGGGRDISLNQISENVTSIFVKVHKEELDATESWRLEWWKRIVNDTIYGENFWSGVGYGNSLARRHGFSDSTGNRSPHNGHLTILARSGVVGLALWITLLATIGVSLLRVIFTARAMHHTVYANLAIWVLGFFCAFLLNASVDVFLEGPQGGIWFWCLVGYAIALTEEYRPIAARGVAAARRRRRDYMPVRRRA